MAVVLLHSRARDAFFRKLPRKAHTRIEQLFYKTAREGAWDPDYLLLMIEGTVETLYRNTNSAPLWRNVREALLRNRDAARDYACYVQEDLALNHPVNTTCQGDGRPMISIPACRGWSLSPPVKIVNKYLRGGVKHKASKNFPTGE